MEAEHLLTGAALAVGAGRNSRRRRRPAAGGSLRADYTTAGEDELRRRVTEGDQTALVEVTRRYGSELVGAMAA